MSEALADHNHQHCIDSAISKAERLCQSRDANLTPVRRRVLELIWRSHEPVGAYALLDNLKDDGFNSAPPTVYRALDFLLEQGLIHRLESRNAFIGCPDPDHPHQGQYLICDTCGTVTELADDEMVAAIDTLAARKGFKPKRSTVEISGTCAACAAA
ncbi:Fur family transcriptional regulator [Lacibacterium aquatile]|uniref:Ferric uptake regulation protein n=1 Tax=Lacibacterium aquatile TaxID=1168082 RepID=A0ABW5DN31_9PROT